MSGKERKVQLHTILSLQRQGTTCEHCHKLVLMESFEVSEEPTHSDSSPADHHEPSTTPRKIPNAVIKRLSLYSRALHDLERSKIEKVSSTQLAAKLGFNSAQVRKDLAYFGQFGVPGFGYPVSELRANIKHILGTDREMRVALIGVGYLGTALLSYGGFSRQGFRILCAFDKAIKDPHVGVDRVPVFRIEELETRLAEFEIDIAILTVSQEAAQEVVNHLVRAGICAVLNFVPIRLEAPDHVKIRYVDLAIEMESLSYYIGNMESRPNESS